MENNIINFNNIEFYKIKDFEGYYISKCGKILSTKNIKLKILKNGITLNQYTNITLCKNTKHYTKTIHRLVAQQFILNPNNKPCVNHIDGNKHNNHISNLEWCTYSENEKHSYNILGKIPSLNGLGKFGKLHHNSKRVKQLDLDGNLIKIWDSMSDIKRDLQIHRELVSKCCRKQRKTTGGFKWEYFQ